MEGSTILADLQALLQNDPQVQEAAEFRVLTLQLHRVDSKE